ncbi:MAG: cation-transporting P-type ATPase [Candidatus Roizmanbacteria bacterium]|nr:cation-transporting P-type ATPase [Candidatus Roizmanbacteria bacterium]
MSGWYSLQSTTVIAQLATRITGLRESEAQSRLVTQGKNILPRKQPPSALSFFIRQFQDVFIVMLLAAAAISFFLGEWIDATSIVVIVLVNAGIGFIQEYKAQKTLDELTQQDQRFARVMRDGELREMAIEMLVPGDVIHIEAGNRIPADARIISSSFCTVDESLLTGESVPVEKQEQWEGKKEVNLGQQATMLFRDTLCMAGKVTAVVVATGAQTQVGMIATLLDKPSSKKTPLQERLTSLARVLGAVVFFLALLLFCLLLLRNTDLFDALLTATALLVSAIPEGLPAVITIVLSLGVVALARKRTIVRRLRAVETLGGVQYLLTDKTGTLTTNTIQVTSMVIRGTLYRVTGKGYESQGDITLDDGKALSHAQRELAEYFYERAALCTDAELEYRATAHRVIGDTTEGALLVAGQRIGVDYRDIRNQYHMLFEEPFSSETRHMVVGVAHKKTGEMSLIVKGAPESIALLCSKKDKEYIHDGVRPMASQGLRVIAMGERILNADERKQVLAKGGDVFAQYLKNITLLGLVGEEDTVRPEVASALKRAREAHIETIMVTGDHVLSAYSLAKQIGIVQHESQVFDASQLSNSDDAYLVKRITSGTNPLRVFARIAPADKLRLVELLRRNTSGVVAVTGDGVNDAPAIHAADVGIAMGITGSDVAKETADIVIADDNYRTIIDAVHQGRIIYDNILKFVHFMLSSNMSEIIVLLAAAGLGFPVFFIPIQILFINLVTDSLSSLALSLESPDASLMRHYPRERKTPLFSRPRWYFLFSEGLVLAGLSLLSYVVALPYGVDVARTVGFLVMVFSQLLHTLNMRSYRESIFHSTHKPNTTLFILLTLSFLLTLALIVIAPLRTVFALTPLPNLSLVGVIALFSMGIVVYVEVRKYIVSLRYK